MNYQSCNHENILFRLSADYKVRHAKTCPSEDVYACSSEQVGCGSILALILGVS